MKKFKKKILDSAEIKNIIRYEVTARKLIEENFERELKKIIIFMQYECPTIPTEIEKLKVLHRRLS
ncbi:MAG: hypothetical protein J7L54_04615 [Elusimicrobia bacterium]|nr:hypothetical protein [Elusimicrobiota bacterium]